MLIIGEKEVNEAKVSVRRQGRGDEGVKSLPEFIEMVHEEVNSRKIYTAT